MDKLDFIGQGTCFIPAGTRATLRGNTNDPIMVLPKDTSAVKVYVSVAIASGMIHSGLIFELDKNNKNYQTCSLITNSSFVENEITPKFFLVHFLKWTKLLSQLLILCCVLLILLFHFFHGLVLR